MTEPINGIDVDAFTQFAERVKGDPDNVNARFTVHTVWKGQTRSVATVKSYELLGETYQRNFTIEADEPAELLGENTAPNPQELLMAALNACMSVGYAAVAASMGITVRSLEIETTGQLDLRGFLGLDANVNPGYDEVSYQVSIDADATDEQIEEIHQAVMSTSPNFANFSKSIKMTPSLVIVGRDAALQE